MSRRLIEVDAVGKTFPPALTRGRARAMARLLLGRGGLGGKRVLEDISFDVRAGESVAVIGANGAGKSTLLKLITGVMAPSEGSVRTSGSIAALLELGAGFEPEYTGLENLRMNAAFLGLTRAEIDERLDDILSFADIGEAVHEPIKHYSSGMVVRLGFAVVASVRPDLLITDEVLAVGDESFQKKCIRWIEGYLAEGGTLLMVSHNMYQVQKLCRHALWLEGGRTRAWGDVFDVSQAYLASDDGEPRLDPGGTLDVALTLHSADDRPPVALVGLVRADGTPVYGVASDHDGVEPVRVGDRTWRIAIRFPRLALLPGGYVVRAHAMDPEGLRVHDTREIEFTVTGRSRALGLVRLEHEWDTGVEE